MHSSPIETIQQILEQLGQETGLADLRLNAHGGCSLDLGDRFVHLELDPKTGELSIYTEVALLALPVKPSLLQLMMQGNYFTLRTAGATLGLEGISGQVVLYLRLGAEQLSYARFIDRFESFVSAADLWAMKLTATDTEVAANTGPPLATGTRGSPVMIVG